MCVCVLLITKCRIHIIIIYLQYHAGYRQQTIRLTFTTSFTFFNATVEFISQLCIIIPRAHNIFKFIYKELCSVTVLCPSKLLNIAQQHCACANKSKQTAPPQKLQLGSAWIHIVRGPWARLSESFKLATEQKDRAPSSDERQSSRRLFISLRTRKNSLGFFPTAIVSQAPPLITCGRT